MNKTKIAIIDPNSKGGHNDYCHSLSKLLSSNNNINVVYINREEKIDKKLFYKHIAAGNNSNLIGYKNVFVNMRKYIKKDYILHFQSINYYIFFLIITLRLSTFHKFNFFYTFHNLKPHTNSPKQQIMYWLLKHTLSTNMFKKIIYHYEFFNNNKNQIIKLPNKVSHKMHFIPHHLFKVHKDIAHYKTNEKRVNILLFGVMRNNKGILEFFKLLTQQNVITEKIDFVVAGEFIDFSEKDLLKVIEDANPPINLQILNSFIPSKEKEKLFAQANYVLLPYKNNFLAQSGLILDAYQYKIPLIVSKNISLKFLVEKESSGYYFDFKNINKIFEKKVFNTEMYIQIITNINNLLKNKYSNISIREKYEYLYKE